MWKYFTKPGYEKWVQVLPDLVKNYKTSYHRSTSPTAVRLLVLAVVTLLIMPETVTPLVL